MEGNRFDDLVRRVATYSSRRGIVRAVAAAAAVPALAVLGLEPADEAAAKKKKKKTTLCVNGQTIQASKKKKKKALKQGATVGACVPPPPPPPPPGTTTTTPSPPACLGAQASCSTGTCCDGLICGDNFCDPEPQSVCCGKFGAVCSVHCDCCEFDSFCNDGTCDCLGIVCDGVCTGGDCCDSDDCLGTQVCSPDGFCECTSGFWCGEQCCDAGEDEVCRAFPQPTTCLGGGCPAYEYCNSDDYYWCSDFCDCVTSIDGVPNCTDFAESACSNCTTDDECGPGLFCLESGEACGGDCEQGAPNFCVSTGCSPLRAARGNTGSFRGKGAAGKLSKTTPAVRGKADREGRKRRQKKGRQDR